MKKIILIICLLLCSACADYTEINDLVIIPGLVIDYKDNQYEITSELILNDTNSKTKITTTKCKLIDKCLANISNESNKNILISHLKVLILTKEVIKENIDFYDYFLRNSKSKLNYNIFIIDRENIKDLFNIKTNQYGVSLYIDKLNKYNKQSISSSTSLSFIDLIYKKEEIGLDTIYPYITINNDNIYLNNTIFFNNENEIILNEKQTINYNILTNNIDTSVLEFNCQNNLFSINIDKVKTKKKYKDNIMNFNIKLIADINNYNCIYNIDSKDTINKLNKITEEELKETLNNIINISKKYNYDYLGIKNYIYKHNNKDYNKLKNLNDIKTNINIDVSINSIGEIRK